MALAKTGLFVLTVRCIFHNLYGTHYELAAVQIAAKIVQERTLIDVLATLCVHYLLAFVNPSFPKRELQFGRPRAITYHWNSRQTVTEPYFEFCVDKFDILAYGFGRN